MSELSPTDAAIRAIEENKRLAAERDTLAREHAELVAMLEKSLSVASDTYRGQAQRLLQRIRDRESKEKSDA